ncbi:alpha/beta hydrolase [Aquibium carbonis]|uniref:Alpha/beta hydrolase n=1 Tax=Aquibium carbonis TaxID=2495581 RepID=A0A429Z212_9HYPH|nr:alpha/beta hydrolase [Aquibium carbonis]RST87674.1 alpha/beta hydrolase [Aquibium carbonis]
MLHHVQSGPPDGAPIVFLHGASFDGRMWGGMLPFLPDCRCLVVDLPGHGRSAGVHFTSFDEAADGVAAVVRRSAHGKVTIVGISMGSYVGLRLLVRHPDLVGHAVFSGFQSGPIAMGRSMRAVMAVSSWMMNFKAVRENMVRSMGSSDVGLVSTLDGKPNASAATTRHVGRLAMDFDARPDLPKVAARTLVLAGEKEHPAIRQSLAVFERSIPSCVSAIAPGMGHGWIAQAPELFARTVHAWMSDSSLPSALLPADR